MSFRTAYGNTVSENGWRMCNRDECDIVRIDELYLVDTAPLRKGAPLTSPCEAGRPQTMSPTVITWQAPLLT